MKNTVRRTAKHHASIPVLLLTQGFEATLSFFCTLFVFSLD
jgi:hypothetical protein